MSLGHIGESLLPLSRISEGWNALCQKAHDALTHFHHEDTTEPAPPEAQRWGLVATDLIDHDDRFELRMELPGLARDDLHVEITASQVVVSGRKHSEQTRRQGHAVITERAFGSFRRVLPLPAGVDADRAQASYTDGVLAVDLPKQAGGARRRLAVG